MGFWDDFAEGLEEVGNEVIEATKEVGKLAVNTGVIREAGANIASGGITAHLIGSGAYLIGKGIKEISKEDGNEFLEGVGDYVENIGHGLTGGLFGLGTSTAGQRKTTTAKCLLRTGQAIKIGSRMYNVTENTKEEIGYIASEHHDSHRQRGVSYDRDCPICRGDC